MKRKQNVFLILTIILTIILTGCSTAVDVLLEGVDYIYESNANNIENITSQKTYSVLELVEVDFPESWFEKDKENPYDLQLFSENEEMTTGIFVYTKEDLADDISGEDVFQYQLEEFESMRKNFEFVEEYKNIYENGKSVKTHVYSGEKDMNKFYYVFSLVEFDDEEEFVVTIQVCFPSKWRLVQELLGEIVDSTRLKDNSVL